MEFAGVSKDREEKPQGKEKKNEEPSISASIQPSIPPAPESRTNLSLPPGEREKEHAQGKMAEVKAEPVEEEKETQPVERVQKRDEEEANEGQQAKEELVEMIHGVASEQQEEVKEHVGGFLFSPSISSPPSRPLRDIDGIVDKHLGDFSSEIQHLLQEESVHYSFPQSPHSTSNTETTALEHTLPHTPISQFSQYVSFYNPCPPVQDYVSSLKDSINSMLTEFDYRWPSHKPVTSRTNADAALANRVSDFVSSIRAANAKTGRDDDGFCGELTAADSFSVSQTPALSRGGEVWQPHIITKQFPDAANNRNPPISNVTLSVTTSASVSVYKPTNAAILHPSNNSPHSHWKPPVAHNNRQTQDDSTSSTVHCTTGVEGGGGLADTNYEVTLSGFSGVPKSLTEPSHPSEPVSSLATTSVLRPNIGQAPPATALSSLISQLQPEVFSSLVEIIKDVKRNSLQFYLHSTEPEDQVYEDVKEHLLKQGNMEQSPMAFLDQESSDSKLLVIIKNKDIAAHVHKIPGLVSLKRHPSVVFVGIDTLDDIRNNSYNELFVSGGCIVSDESVLNPDFITHDRLAALLMFLEQHSSPDSVWRWKIHCKTHKKLKEQSRFRREAANLLDVLSAYQKRQIVEFLPYHHCDMMNHHSPNLDCLMELQARYTQYRHTVFLTDQHFEKFPAYSSGGIIVASIEGILHDFPRLVGYHDIKDKQPIISDMLSPKEHIHPLSSLDQPQHLLQQSSPSLHPLSHLSDQLVPDTSCKEGVLHHSGTDFEVLRLAISQLRAERKAQLHELQQQQAKLCSNPPKSFLSNTSCTDSHSTSPLLGQRHPSESVQFTPGSKAVAATLELIHSALQPELGEEEMRADGAETPTEGWRSGGSRGGAERVDQRDGTPIRVENWSPCNSDKSTTSSNQNTAAVTGPSNQIDSTKDGRGKANQQGEPAFSKGAKRSAASSSTTVCPVEGDSSRDTQSGQELPKRGEGAPPRNSNVGTASGTKVTGSLTMVTNQEDNPNPALSHLQQIQQTQQHLQQLNNQQQQLNEQQQLLQNLSHLQQPPLSQQQRGDGLLHPLHLPRLPSQSFSGSPLLGPLTNLGGGLLGATPVWPGALGPAGAALVWGFQQTGRNFSGHRLMGGFHNPVGQGGNRYRGRPRGGGFNGM